MMLMRIAMNKIDRGIARAEQRAQEILKEFGLPSVANIDIRDLAYALGLRVLTRPIRGAEGRLVRSGSQAIAVIDAGICIEGKRRFVTAHELGHYELHINDPMFVTHRAALSGWGKKNSAETEANRFAAELLMPQKRFAEEARASQPSIAAVERLAAAYRVTLTATAIRYVQVDAFPCALAFSQHGRIQWAFVSDSLPLRRICDQGPVHPHSGAGEFFKNGTTSLEPERTPVEAWFRDDALVPGQKYLEQCRMMSEYDACLSLIWVG